MATDERDEWTISHFALSNPDGPDEASVPKLLRALADHIDTLGEITIQDITFSSHVSMLRSEDIAFTVYYYRAD
jgi:hypothetical protein